MRRVPNVGTLFFFNEITIQASVGSEPADAFHINSNTLKNKPPFQNLNPAKCDTCLGQIPEAMPVKCDTACRPALVDVKTSAAPNECMFEAPKSPRLCYVCGK